MHSGNYQTALLLLAVSSVLFPQASRAGEGVIEINQARALAGGITPGDTPGFPVTISLPGSYRLTSNLTVTDPTASAILLATTDVSLDLNGFAILGPVSCTRSGSVVSCTSSNPADGVSGGLENRVVVRNGTVSGFGRYGLFLGSDSRVENVLAMSNANSGMSLGSEASVEDSRAVGNGQLGIQASNLNNIIQRCIAEQNGGVGILAGARSLVVGNQISANGAMGIEVSGGVLQDNMVANNQGTGIIAGSGTVASDNSAFQNHGGGDGISANVGVLVSDNSASYNDANGISANGGSSVYGNNTISNGTNGLNLVPTAEHPAAFRENVMDGNATSVANGVNLGTNYCNGTTCK